ncbi:MAG: hypothetical protein E7564_05905 [Ruminococcaceae bacterium]|nr:hypothetical protein [Oscillospiraceae bacterium]
MTKSIKSLLVLFLLFFITILSSCGHSSNFTSVRFEDVIYEYDLQYYLNYQKIPPPYFNDSYYLDSVSYPQWYIEKIENQSWKFFHEDQYRNATGGCVAELINYEIRNNTLCVWTFKLKEIVFGDIPQTDFQIIQKLSYTEYDVHLYEVGKDYFFTTTYKWDSNLNCNVFSFVKGMHVNLTDLTDFSWYRGKITFPDYATREGVINYFRELAENYGYKEK